jgi:hypothetical protein
MSMFTDRLRTDRNPFDNWDLREQAADRIEALAGLNTEFQFALRYSAKRIEALEAALRKIADSQFTGETAWRQGAKIARAVLAPEQDK